MNIRVGVLNEALRNERMSRETFLLDWRSGFEVAS